jgi:hypothetical protein
MLVIALTCAALAAFLTAAATALIGFRIAVRSRLLAFLTCGLIVPTCFAIWAAAELVRDRTPGALDKTGIFLALCLVAELVAVPASLLTSALVLLRHRAANGASRS